MPGGYQVEWEAPRFLQNLPQLLLPRILAEGYYLDHCDAGKQVYCRRSPATRSWWDFIITPNRDKVRRGTVLVVSYILTPTSAKVVFRWDNPLRLFCDEWYGKWVADQAKGFLKYLDDWWQATQERELTQQ
jgi:hypothetical protein